jgi:predicted Mrr-cat superfamily restriction endonuclease
MWLVRAEREGADEQFNFREGVTSIHWNDALDPRTQSRKELEAFFDLHPDWGGDQAAEQVYNFCYEMQVGEFVVTPLWNNGRKYEKVAVGIVTGAYDYLDHNPEPAPRQTRTAVWLRKDLERESLQEETQNRLLYRYTCRLIHDEGIVRDILRRALDL